MFWKQLRLGADSQYAAETERILKKAFEKFKIDKDDFLALNLLYEDEPEVEAILMQMEMMTDQAISGKLESTLVVPEFLTEQKTLELISKNLDVHYLEMLSLVLKMKKERLSSNDLKDPKIIRQINEQLPQIDKFEFLEKEGLGSDETHPLEVYQEALNKYKGKREFNESVILKEKEHEEKIQKLMNASIEELELIQREKSKK